MTAEADAHQWRLRRPWRLAFVGFAIALTTATHWPQLRLSPAVPATDTDLHFISFALLTFFLARTRWIGPWWLVMLLAATWGVVDEVSQAIPILNRTVSWRDGSSNVLGALSMGVWLWAMKPPHATLSAAGAYAFDRVFLRWTSWGALALMGLACASMPLFAWFLLDPTATRVLIIFASCAAMMFGTVILSLLWRRETARVCSEKPCFACGESCKGIAFSRDGRSLCPRCRQEVQVSQWLVPGVPSTRVVLSPTVLLKVAGIFAGTLLVFAALLAIDTYATSIYGTAAAERWPGRAAIAVGSYRSTFVWPVIAAALFMRIANRRMEEVYRNLRCPRCGHDLRGTPTRQDLARCGECGAEFIIHREAVSVRSPHQPASIEEAEAKTAQDDTADASGKDAKGVEG